jgi:ligand-binding sensor domain-containing protein/signal transduction histidine kinase/DNA-binding response OmpR family regulator
VYTLFKVKINLSFGSKVLFGVFLVLFKFTFVIGQVQQLTFKHLTINEGLSQNTVFCIYQDNKGFIWFGTEDGLNRYDGYEFKIFKNELNKPRSLLNNQVNVITEDSNHQLIIGTAGGLSFFNRETEDFTNVVVPRSEKDLQSSNFVTSFAFYDQQLWIGTYDGLKLYDLKNKRFLLNALPKEFNGNGVQTLFKEGEDKLWVSFKNDLKCLNLKNRQRTALPVVLESAMLKSPGNVRVIKQDRSGMIWLGTEQAGLFCLSSNQQHCVNYRHDPSNVNSLPVNVVRDLYFNDDGKVWIATRRGLSVFDPKAQHFFTYTHDKYDAGSLSHRSILTILPDRLGNIWIGTYAGGVNIYHASYLNFTVIGEQMGSRSGLNNAVVSSILHDKDGGLWIGTEGGGLNHLNRTNGRFESYELEKKNAASENIIKCLASDGKGNIWVGAFDGLNYFNTTTKSFKRFPLKKDAAYRGRTQIYSLLADGDGLWVGTNGGGLVYLDPTKKEERVFVNNPKDKNSLIGNNIAALAKDKKGNLWVGTLQGLSFFDLKMQKITSFVHQADDRFSLTSNNITCLFIDSKARFWIGTRGGGLNLYDAVHRRFYGFTEKDGLANNVIRAINEDKQGRIWLSSNKGITVFDPAKISSQKLLELSFKNYTVTDGLQSNQFLSNSTDLMPSGELFFGGINGISTFLPEHIGINKMVSPVVFTDFLINNKTIDFSKENSPIKKNVDEYRDVTLPYDQANITVKFAMLNYLNTNKNTYAYKLQGFSNDDWHYVKDQRIATYTNLDAGKYVFMVKAANGDGVWSTHVDQIFIRVLPPWYKTWWAYVTYLLIIAGLLYLFYYFSYKTAKLKNALDFEQLNHEKDQELSQRKLTFFTHISHEIKTPLTLIISPIEKLLSTVLDQKVQQQLQLIYRNGERLMRLTNQLLDYRKFETGNMKLQAAEGNIVRFTKEVMAAFQSYAVSKQIEFRLLTERKSFRVWFDRDKMEKVMYNIISNALKFTPGGGTILIRLKELESQSPSEQAWIIIEIEDNGIGIPDENLATIFDQFQHYNTNGINNEGTGLGLSFSKGLIEMHHGKIEVSSKPANAKTSGMTIFSIALPLGNAHLSNAEIIQNYNDSEDIRTYANVEVINLSEKTIAKKQEIKNSNAEQKLLMLIVEDNAEVLQFVASHFAEDFEVITAADGAEGWTLATEVIPDIIISDVMMPNLTGTELCANLKNDARTSHIPIILLTARETLLYKIEGLETGADDYIVKPFNLRHLEVRVWSLLESRIKLREKYSRDLTLQPANISITSIDEKFLEKVMSYIEANIAESSLSVEGLSREVGMSKTTLYRKLKALTNQNTNEFIRTIRLNRAAQLLKQKKLNVSEVAYLVGFNDQDYFRKCFKEQFGCTPKAYADKA